ncbi:MAG: helix-turn-helix transcriptional regulator [Bacilli bacterium]|nr:helix-turn-helix transcriptional regulator [Bacilli bacterium]
MNRLKDLREDKDLLQKDIARIFHLTQTNYSKYELGKINIPIDLLIKFALFYNTSTDYILGLTNNKKAYKKVKVQL